MNRRMKNPIKDYYLQLKEEVPLFYSQRRALLKQAKYSLKIYAAEHTDITLENLIRDYGKPSELADSLIIYESPKNIRKGLFLNKRARIIILLLCLLLVFTAVAVIKITGEFATQGIVEYEVVSGGNNFYEEEIIEEEIVQEEIVQEDNVK